MKRLSVVAVLLLVAACGGSSEPDEVAPSLTDEGIAVKPTPSASPECDKLARRWAVEAEELPVHLYIGLREKVDESIAAMSDATKEMSIEGCTGSAVELATMGNYQAALALAKLATCRSADVYVCGERAGDFWKREGVPLLVQVRVLVS